MSSFASPVPSVVTFIFFFFLFLFATCSPFLLFHVFLPLCTPFFHFPSGLFPIRRPSLPLFTRMSSILEVIWVSNAFFPPISLLLVLSNFSFFLLFDTPFRPPASLSLVFRLLASETSPYLLFFFVYRFLSPLRPSHDQIRPSGPPFHLSRPTSFFFFTFIFGDLPHFFVNGLSRSGDRTPFSCLPSSLLFSLFSSIRLVADLSLSSLLRHPVQSSIFYSCSPFRRPVFFPIYLLNDFYRTHSRLSTRTLIPQVIFFSCLDRS